MKPLQDSDASVSAGFLLATPWLCQWESQAAVPPEWRLGCIRGTSAWQHGSAGGVSLAPEPRMFTIGPTGGLGLASATSRPGLVRRPG